MLHKLPSLLIRVSAGTLVFILVLAAVQSDDARISGMMLTFPALNGISLLMARLAEPRAMARSMLGIIALNGVVSLAFIESFSALAAVLGPDAAAWVWPLSGLAFAVWLFACWILTVGPVWCDSLLLRGFVILAPLLACLWWRSCPAPLALPPDGSGFLADIVRPHALRIALFALTLGALLIASEMLGAANALLGRLGAFPLLPLFSLATIAEAGGPAGGAGRLAIVKPAMLLGLLLAMAFAWAFSGHLAHLRGRLSGLRWWLAALAALAGGWMLCGTLIIAGMRAVSSLEGCQ